MSIVSCTQGHYYDNEKHKTCPFCADSSKIESEDKTQGFLDYGDDEITVGFTASGVTEDDHTVGYFEEHLHMNPLVGWLVCKEGTERGRDFRLHTGRNYIGRSLNMDVIVESDSEISRDKHCSVVYDPKHDEFLLAPGPGTITYHNGSNITESVVLETGDEIRAGNTLFVFVAYCKGERTWL